MTEQPISDPEYDIYRHPLAHGDASTEAIGGFKKTFDIYSLGIVLMEIALWQPIHQLLGIQSPSNLKPNMTRKVRSRLLGERNYLAAVRSDVGEIFAAAVGTCLAGEFGISLELEVKEDEAAKLQRAFHTNVVRRLSSIVV
jgi:hypothetical protein